MEVSICQIASGGILFLRDCEWKWKIILLLDIAEDKLEVQFPCVLHTTHFFTGLQETAKGTHDGRDVDLVCPFERSQRLNKVIVIFLAYLHSEQMWFRHIQVTHQCYKRQPGNKLCTVATKCLPDSQETAVQTNTRFLAQSETKWTVIREDNIDIGSIREQKFPS